MFRILNFSLLFVFLFTSASFAGFGSYDNPYSRDGVIAPVMIKDKGIYNLIVSVQFLNEPYDKKIYESDEYESFLQRLKVEWSGIAITEILKSKEQSINELVTLKANIESSIANLADKLKEKYKVQHNTEVVFSISAFYIIEPKND